MDWKKELFQEIEVEKLQKLTGKNINTMNLNYHRSIVPEIPKADFFQVSNIAVTKHARYSYTPAHTHHFIELNYMFNGNCTQRLNGETFHLKKGNLLLLDRKVIQQIDYVGQEDILVNFLIDSASVQSELLPNLPQSTNLITDFFFHSPHRDEAHTNYILLDLSEQLLAKKIIESLILTIKQTDNATNPLLRNLLFSALMVESTQAPVLATNKNVTKNEPLIQILQHLNNHYTDITLEKLGETFGYNKNYLSNLLKDKTGSSFQELIDQKRLSEAKRLMNETEDSLSTIALKIGYKSVPSIFKLFKKETGQTPDFFRKQMRMKQK